MPASRLYQCENTVGTNAKYSKGTTTVGEKDEGICKGQAIAWVQNMLTGAAPKLTKPSYDKSAALQVLYEMSGCDNSAFFSKANLVVNASVKGSGHTILNYITNNPGVYQIRYDGHALAAANQGGKFYFFDSEAGLFECDSALDFTVKFLEGYSSADFDKAWKFN